MNYRFQLHALLSEPVEPRTDSQSQNDKLSVSSISAKFNEYVLSHKTVANEFLTLSSSCVIVRNIQVEDISFLATVVCCCHL